MDARFERVDADLGLVKSAVIDQGRRMGRIEGDLRDVHVRLDSIEGRLSDENLRAYVGGIVDDAHSRR
jgi:hypothetical protein